MTAPSMTQAAVISIVILCGVGVGPVAESVQIDVDAAGPRVTVSPTLYGISFEEINHAGEGGLYGEMVQNRDLEIAMLPAGASWVGNLLRTESGWYERKWFGSPTQGWSLLAVGGTIGSISLDDAQPLNERNPHSLCLFVRKMGAAAGVANEGFWGMGFVAQQWYDLSFYARTEGDERFDLTVSLESAGGAKVYTTTVVRSVGGPWQRYTCRLRAGQTDPRGRLAIRLSHAGTIWFDVVSLFPGETFKGRPNGLRPDLAQTLADLKPAFVRFPGGATVSGLNLDNRLKWKDSLGDIAQRRGTMNLWGYWTSNGLGFHEYLQMCEDLGAAALWVCNPGFSDSQRRPEVCRPSELQAFIQEALDALEYALGPADSEWGAQRVANGHPEPFDLKYIEIGNEAGSQVYQSHYRQFYHAIKAGYPQVTIISNSDFSGRAPVEVVDHHKYGDPGSFFDDFRRYDSADRKGPKVYVGAYGCNRGVGEGGLMAALSEAVFLMGLERNSDIVMMASYAPLLFNVNDKAWPIGLVGFNSARVAPRSSYYVQMLLSLNRPDEVVQVRMTPALTAQDQRVYVVAGLARESNELVIKAVNRADVPCRATIRITGFEVEKIARAITLSHDDPSAENSVYDPDVIVPVEAPCDGAGPQFDYTFGTYSLTVLRLKVLP
jgi:alpha-L-arabinofuranosidase